MANIVEQIHDELLSITATELGSSWRKMRRVFAPEIEDLRQSNTYGVLHGAADSSETTFRTYTLDHLFSIKLGRVYVDRGDDDVAQDVINEMYDQHSELLKTIQLSKINLPNIVLVVTDPSFDEPEVLENNVVVLTQNFTVRYREAVV